MCIKTALRATALCSLPTFSGFGAGLLSVASPRIFLGLVFIAIAVTGYACIHKTVRAGRGDRAYDVEQVGVTAGALLAVAWLFAFWTGVGAAAGYGLVPTGVLVAASMTLLAAFTITFVRRVIERQVPWLERIVETLLPEATRSREVASRR